MANRGLYRQQNGYYIYEHDGQPFEKSIQENAHTIVNMEEAILRKADQAKEEFNKPDSLHNYWVLRRMRSDAVQFSARVEEIRKLPNEGHLMRPQPMTERETLINEAGHICLQMTHCRILRGGRLYCQWSNYLRPTDF